MELTNFKRISIITGHYGSGKTNVAVNLALQLKEQHEKVTIVDLDIVNPYFRTSDFTQMLSEKGIKVIAPVYANTNLDIPALPPSINSIFDNKDSFVIVDVGGDDAGAIALGQFSNRIKNSEYDMYYVINECRF
ncbi:MAG: P-loop NTPase, partial [Oscillospiraceae bacterium]